MSQQTPQHGWLYPAPGDQDWGTTLNALFNEIDGDVAEWGPAADRPSSPAVAGAGYIETDTGDVYLGSSDASSWSQIGTLAQFDPQTIDQESDLGLAVSTDSERAAHAATPDAHHPPAYDADRDLQPEGAQSGLAADATGIAYEGTMRALIDTPLVGGTRSTYLEAATASSAGDEVVSVELYDDTAAAVVASLDITGGSPRARSADISTSLTSGNEVHVRWNVTTASATTDATFDAIGARILAE